jgi:hypothetical protein
LSDLSAAGKRGCGDFMRPIATIREHLNPAIYRTQYADRESIQQIADYIIEQPDEFRKAAANHFTYFDPENPDYSYLSGR